MRKSNRQKTAQAFSDYNAIWDDKDLKKAKLTLADYNAIPDVLGNFASVKKDAKATTIYGNVAAWMQRYGFTVTEKNGYFVVTF